MRELSETIQSLPAEFFKTIAENRNRTAEVIGMLAMRYLGQIEGLQAIFELEPEFVEDSE